MLPPFLTVILFSTLSFQVNCIPVKRSIFDISPIQFRFSSNAQTSNPNARQSNKPLFSIPDIQAPFQFAGNILKNNITPRRYYDTAENSLNGRVQLKYKMNPNFNQATEDPGKVHTLKVTTIKPAATTLLAKDENLWAGNDIFNTPSIDIESSDSDSTESTTEIETTTIDDLLNRMAIPSSVLASLAG